MKQQKKILKKEKNFSQKNPQLNQLQELDKKKWITFYSFFLVAISFGIYWNTLSNGYVLDDFSVIKENNIVNQGTKGIPLIWKSSYRFGYLNVNDGLYRPLTLTIFALEWQLFPDKPAFAHFINILVFSLSMFFGFRFFAKIVKSEFIAPLFLTFLLFVVHPLHTEVVGNIKSFDEIMCFSLSLLGLGLMYNYDKKENILFLVLSILVFFASLLFKESAILFLAILPMFLWYFTEQKILKIVLTTSLFLIPILIFFAIRKNILGSYFGLEQVSVIDNLLVAAKTFQEKIATIFYILAYYLKLMIAPFPLLYNYSYNQIPIVGFSNVVALFSVVVHLVIFVIAILSLKQKKMFGFGIWFMLIGLGLYSNLFATIGAAMGERFYYFSSFGGIWFFVFGIFYVLNIAEQKVSLFQWTANSKLKYFLFFVVAVSVVFSYQVYSRNKDWKNNITLYRNDMPKSLNSARSHYYLGNELVRLVSDTMKNEGLKKEMLAEAENHLLRSLEIIPDYNDCITQLGVCYYRGGNYKDASIYYEKALKNNPNDALSINNLAAIYFATGKYDQAIGMYKRAIELNPRFADAWVNIGSCMGMTKRYQESIEAFEKAIEIDPSKAKAYFFMSKSYEFLGNSQKAKEYAQLAKQIDPSL
jgi:tetratricopeptide (TPR) repeat protein